SFRIGQRDFFVDRGLLIGDVEAEIDRTPRIAHGDAIAAHDGGRKGFDTHRLVVPLDEVAHQITLYLCRMDPVDPRTAFTRIHRPRAAHDHHRSVIAPGVVDRHRGMLKANHVVDNGGHDLTRRFFGTMRHPDGGLFVAAENHLRVGLTAALVIDERIVNTAKTRPWVERHVFNAKYFQ